MDIIYLIIIVTIFVLSVYIILHSISYALTVFFSTKRRKLVLRNKYMLKDYLNNLIVVVYSHNQEKAATYMLEALNKQNYLKSNCQFHFILDNCTDNSANMLEFVGGAKIWKVGDGVTLGKDESISWLLERLILVKNTDAFVFIDVDRQIEPDFLESVNKSLMVNDIVVGETELVPEEQSLLSDYLQVINKYNNKILNTGRTLLHLASVIDVNCFAIKHSILEDVKYVDFKNTLSPYKYTLLLAKKGYFAFYDPNVKSKMSLKQFLDMRETFSHKFSLFLKSLPHFVKCKFRFNELLMNIISPSAIGTILVSAILLGYTYYFYFCLDTPVFLATSGLILAVFLFSLLLGGFSVKDDCILTISFLLKPLFKVANSNFVTKIENMIKHKKPIPVVKSATRKVLVTDGKNNLTCELDLISEDGMSKAVLKFKRKKYASEYYLRMYDAINDIVSTLNEHGFRVKICASCGYFTSTVDGTTNMIKGTCSKCVVDNTAVEPVEVLLWNGCENYIPQEVHKVIDIASFRDKSAD